MISMKEAKRTLRIWMIKERQAIPPQKRTRQSRAIARHVTASAVFKKAKTIAIFLGFGSEVQTDAIVQKAWALKKKVLIPMTDYGLHKSYFVVFQKGDRLTKTNRGPMELIHSRKPFPMKSIDLVLVPGLAYDRKGYRLGYGGGVYDLLLKKATRAASIGIFFSMQELVCVPREAHDQALDGVMTEKESLTF